MKSLVLLSGGLDSTVALFEAARRGPVSALTVLYGQKHAEQELQAAKAMAATVGLSHTFLAHTVVDIGDAMAELAASCLLGQGTIPEAESPLTIVPGRNAILLSLAATLAQSQQAESVVFSAHGGDGEIFPDCRPDFVRAMSEAVKTGTGGAVVLMAPFIGFSKAEIVRRGVALRVPLERTYSCYNGGEIHCGRCGACRTRRAAFADAVISDGTDYRTDPTWRHPNDF